MKIKSIYINGLHNAVNKTYEFGDLAYIYGTNGIGKSTILQAIQFALLGYIPGTAKNSKEALLRHSPNGTIDIKITLLSDNGHEISIQRNVNQNGNFKSIIPDNPNYEDEIAATIKELELPIFNFNDFVGQTANKLKEYFIKNLLPTVEGSLDWEQILTGSIIDCNFQDREEVLKYGMSLVSSLDGDILEQVIAANATFKDEQSYNKAELQRLQNTIDSLIYYDDYIGPTNLDEINSKLLELSILRDRVLRYESALHQMQSNIDGTNKVQQDIDARGGKAGYETLLAELPKLQQQYKELSEIISTKQTALTELRTVDANAEDIIQSHGECPYTKESCKAILTKIEDLRNESANRKALRVSLTEDINARSNELNECNLKIRKCESAITEFNSLWDKLTTLKGLMKDMPEKPDTDKTVLELDQEIAALTQSKEKLQANIQYNETIENITKLKYEAELKNEALAKWVKKTDTNGLQTTLMTRPFEELANTMTGYIQQMYGRTDITAHFNISSKANSFSFGLIRGGVYIPYDLLSSGEKCLYSLALMICITNTNKSPLKLLLCDDMFDHLDQNAIESTFATLKNLSGIQFIFAGVKECANAADVIMTV